MTEPSVGGFGAVPAGVEGDVLESQCLLVMPIENGTAIAERPWLNNPDSISPRLGSGCSEGYLRTQ